MEKTSDESGDSSIDGDFLQTTSLEKILEVEQRNEKVIRPVLQSFMIKTVIYHLVINVLSNVFLISPRKTI